nr:MAG TPA: hypothetical protein [Bacteriophage sp.]
MHSADVPQGIRGDYAAAQRMSAKFRCQSVANLHHKNVPHAGKY